MSNKIRAEEFCDWLEDFYKSNNWKNLSNEEVREIFIQRLIIMQEIAQDEVDNNFIQHE